jgi:uracil-DNA glycosylase family 4
VTNKIDLVNCNVCPFKEKTKVFSEGPLNAKIVLIAEAPGEHEEEKGRPMIGPSGWKLDKLLRIADIDRQSEVLIVNTIKCRPPDNEINSAAAKRAIELCRANLIPELKRTSGNVYVPTGNTALRALGIQENIGKARGAIYQLPWPGKVIPTWHPAYITRQWQEFVTAVNDWRKIKRHSTQKHVTFPDEKFILNPSESDVVLFCRKIIERADSGQQTYVSIDIENYIAHQMETAVKTVALAINDQEVLVIPFIKQNGQEYWTKHSEAQNVIMALGAVLEHHNVTKIVFNANHDFQVLMNHGWTVNGPIIDEMVAHHMIFHPAEHNLNYVTSIYSDYQPWKHMRESKDDESFRRYNARDAAVLFMNLDGIMADLADNDLLDLFWRVMANVLPTIRMMLNGIWLDRSVQKEVSDAITAEVNKMEAELKELSGIMDFNPRSTQDVGQELFEVRGMKSQVKTDGGKLSVKEEVLNRLMLRYPEDNFVPLLAEFRRVDKQRSTYINPPVLSDGRVHSSFSFIGAESGRYSSQDPNLQNLPNKGRDAQGYIRKMYAAPPESRIISSDKSQAELRVMAMLAGDKVLLEAFADKVDIHKKNAIDIFGEYTPEFRLFAKRAVFAWNYMSEGYELKAHAPKEVLERGNIDQLRAKWLVAHPAIVAYWEKIEKAIRDSGRIVSPFGRCFYFDRPRPDKNINKHDHRSGVALSIQSCVADIMHTHMAEIDRELEWPDDKIILQLHDALYLEVLEKRVQSVARIVNTVMSQSVVAPNGMVFTIPTETVIGPNLFDLKEQFVA